MNTLSIIMPVFNEEETVKAIIYKILEQPRVNQLIIVDDASTDYTWPQICEIEDARIIKVQHEKNKGKGAALKTGIPHSTSEITGIHDADLEYDPTTYSEILSPFDCNQADVVYGSRFLGNGPQRCVYYWHFVGNRFLTTLSNMLTNINLTDMETCQKFFRTDLLQSIEIQEKRFGFEPEITAKVAKKKARIYEVPIPYYGRTYEEGKKINWKDGFSAIRSILKYNLF